MEPTQKLYQVALEFLGIDASPKDTAPDSLACAESVENIFHHAFGYYIGGGNSTHDMWQAMERQKNLFEKVDVPTHGCIIISPTGTNSEDNPVKHGHVGICGKNRIMSNDSNTGKWLQLFTLETWRMYYGVKGGFPVYFYKSLELK